MPGHVRMLDNFVINKDVGKYILSRINPMLGQVTQMPGRINVETDDISLPLGPEIKTSGHGRVMVDLSNLQVEPAGPLGDLLYLTGLARAGQYVMSVQKTTVSLGNGRITCDKFVMRVADFDFIYRGWVDFDDNVNMVVSIPLTPNLLEKIHIPGLPGGKHDFKGLRVDIPIKGKRRRRSSTCPPSTGKKSLRTSSRRAAACFRISSKTAKKVNHEGHEEHEVRKK